MSKECRLQNNRCWNIKRTKRSKMFLVTFVMYLIPISGQSSVFREVSKFPLTSLFFLLLDLEGLPGLTIKVIVRNRNLVDTRSSFIVTYLFVSSFHCHFLNRSIPNRFRYYYHFQIPKNLVRHKMSRDLAKIFGAIYPTCHFLDRLRHVSL